MNIERLHTPPESRVLDLLRRSASWAALAGLIEAVLRRIGMLRQRIAEPDTSIAWEDGEVDEDREARR